MPVSIPDEGETMKTKLKRFLRMTEIGSLSICAIVGIEWIHVASERDLGMPLILWIVLGSLSMIRVALEIAIDEWRIANTQKGIRYTFTSDGVQLVRDAFRSIADEARMVTPRADPQAPDSPSE